MALKVLSALDSAKVQWYHYKAIVVAGMGLFTDAYDLFCIPPIMILLGRIYYPSPKYEIRGSVASIMLGTSFLGTVVGQLVFGYLGDRVGRRRVYGLSLMLMVLSSLLCGLSLGTSRTCVLATLGFFRFVLGLGIGGDYPLSATIMAEFANRRTRGAFVAAVFSMQGFGILVSSLVTMVVCKVFDRAAAGGDAAPWVVDLAWRVIVMLGAVPAAMTCYWRMMMPETARYTALVQRNVEQATRDMQTLAGSLTRIAEEIEEEQEPQNDCPTNNNTPTLSSNLNNYSLLSKQFLHRHGRDLFACAACWLLVDIVYYGNNLFQYPIFKLSSEEKSRLTAFEEAFRIAKIQFILAISTLIPGYYATVYFIDRLGRVTIQMAGFVFMALTLFALVLPQFWSSDGHHINVKPVFLILYGLTFTFANFGPNTTTFIVPAELFPARLRTTCHGISGAAGKIGAIIGSIGFSWASRNEDDNGYKKGIGMRASFAILGGVCILGAFVTYLFTFETMQRSLEENEKEDDCQTNSVWFVRSIIRSPFRRRARAQEHNSDGLV